MGVFKNDVGRPSNKTILVRNILKGVGILVLVSACFIAGMYFNNEKNIKQKENDNNILSKEKNNKKEVSKSKAKKELERYVLFNYSDLIHLDDENSDGYKGLLAIKNSESVKKYTCEEILANEKKRCKDFVIYEDLFYEYETVNTEYKKLFNGNLPKEDIGVNFVYMENYLYSEAKDGFVFLSPEGGKAYPQEITNIYNAYEINNELHIKYTSVVYFYGDKLEVMSVDSKTLERKIIEDVKISDEGLISNKEEIFEKYENELPKYELVLIKKNDSYIYKEIKEIK